jgi:hypothetical protein
MSRRRPSRDRSATRLALSALYWLLVLAVSLVIVGALLLFLEARDASQLGQRSAPAGPIR